MPDDLLSDADLCKLLEVSPGTTLRWRAQGDGPPFVRIGGRRLAYYRQDVEAWLKQHRFTSLAAEASAKT